ncbi:MAG: hypothetical protein HXY43_17880 [Fischerella sp.]|nr:hypothetical protein [Fischerella sp.]
MFWKSTTDTHRTRNWGLGIKNPNTQYPITNHQYRRALIFWNCLSAILVTTVTDQLIQIS